jgi:hypothetical protein
MTTSYPIGGLILHPHRDLLDRGAPVAIGGRALDLLSVLAEAGGGVVSKDELLTKVWGRTIVDDNAVQAQVSIARKALGSEAKRLVTVHRHGYRLALGGKSDPASAGIAVPGSAPEVTAPVPPNDGVGQATGRRMWTRRAAAGSVIVAGAGAAIGLALWPRLNRHQPDPRAVKLYQRARHLSQSFDLEAEGLARSLYEQAVTIDPKFADAWGALALWRRGALIANLPELGDPGLVRAAARRALALDPEQADAQLALILLYPPYRRWPARERQLRAFLADHPRLEFGQVALALLLLDVGRCEDAVVVARKVNYLDPGSPLGWSVLGMALELAGRFEEADLALTRGSQLFPDHMWLWLARYWLFLNVRRYREAAVFARDRSRRPKRVPAELAEKLGTMADDLTTPQGIARWRADRRYAKPQSPRRLLELTVVTAPVLARLGMTDEVFEGLGAYYFGGSLAGARVAAPGPHDPRVTSVLFSAPLLALRKDPRFDGCSSGPGSKTIGATPAPDPISAGPERRDGPDEQPLRSPLREAGSPGYSPRTRGRTRRFRC